MAALSRNTEVSQDFARSCTSAALGYARATTAAYATMAQQAMAFWAEATKIEPKQKPLSFSVTRPSRSSSTQDIPNPFDPFGLTKPWMALEREAMANAKAWWGLFPFEGNPASWPMAFQMMKQGVPRNVALPAAEANIAAMEAATIAQQTVARIFSAYQTGGGHSAAHFTPRAITSMYERPQQPAFNPATLMWPWLATTRKSA